MKMKFASIGRIAGLTMIVLGIVIAVRLAAASGSASMSGFVSIMPHDLEVPVGSVRSFYLEANGVPDSGDIYRVLTEGSYAGLSLQQEGPFASEVDVAVTHDHSGYAHSVPIYIKALAPKTSLFVGATSYSFISGDVAYYYLPASGTPQPSPGPNTNPAPTVKAIGVGEITPYWLVTPAPVASAWRNQTVQFVLQPNDFFGIAKTADSTTWAPSIGVDMQIDSAGNGKTPTFYLKGKKSASNPVSFSASSANHFAVASQNPSLAVAQVTLIDWVPYSSAHPVDNNPMSGGGKRIYADKNDPSQSSTSEAWRLIGIKAKITPAISGMSVRLKVFDVDDPSSNDSVLDPNGLAGNDNREFTYALGGNLVTDASGIAQITYKVSTRPGDNYRVAATVTSKPLVSTDPLRQKFESIGTDTLDGTMLATIGYSGTVPECGSTTFSNTESISASQMLTIWRRLHIELDSMGLVAHNSATGSFSGAQNDRWTFTSTLTLDTHSARLDPNRFQGGYLLLKQTYGAPPLGFEVKQNDANSLTITDLLPADFSFSNDTFVLYDDDNFDQFGGYNPHTSSYPDGDIGENIPAPDTRLIQDSDDPAKNVFAPAYVRPKYDLAGSDDWVPFKPNFEGDTTKFDNIANQANPEFWTIYLLNAYQDEPGHDCDPDFLETGRGSCGVAKLLGTDRDAGVMFWVEQFTDIEDQYRDIFDPLPSFMTRQRLVALMVGRLFDPNGDGGIMDGRDCTANCVEFTDSTRAKIRTLLNP